MKTNGMGVAIAAVLSVVGLVGTAAGQTIHEDYKVVIDEPLSVNFGESVAVSGSIAIASSPRFEDESLIGSVYAIDVNTGEQLTALVPDVDEGEFVFEFGRSIAINGNIVAVGGFVDPLNEPASGRVFVFDVKTGQQLFTIDDPTPSARSTPYFGFAASIAMSESVIIVGDSEDPLFGSNGMPMAHAFDASTGMLLFSVAPESEPYNHFYGKSVAVSDSRFAVGSSDSPFQVDVYELSTGQKLYDVSPPEYMAGYSSAMDLNEQFLVVGAWGNRIEDDRYGSVFVYDAATGELLREILAPEGEEIYQFAWSLDVDGSAVVVGSFWDEPGSELTGAAYVFDLNSGEQLLEVNASDSEVSDDFGVSVAIDGSTVVVGRPQDNEVGQNAGAAYIFTLSPFACPGDTTGDGTVDLDDLNLVLTNFGSTTTEGDANGDGTVDLDDLNLVLSNFGTSCD